MITDLDNTLKQLLLQRVPLDADEVEISFDCPTREWSGKVRKPTVSLYLFDVRENLEFRVGQVTTQNGPEGRTGRKLPPVYLDLSYMITVWAPTVPDEHRLLWQSMVALLREPVIGEDILQGALKDSGPPIKTATAQMAGVLGNMADFWGALDNDLKPAVSYTATVFVDLDMMVEAPLVLTKEITLGDLNIGRRRALMAIGGTVRTKSKRGAPVEPVVGAQVTFPRLGITVRSDGDGRFVVPEIPRGRHRVRVATTAGRAVESEVEVPGTNYDLEV